MRRDAWYWIEKLRLCQHPEGGWYARTFQSDEILDRNSLPERYPGARLVYTVIYYLLKGSEFSAFHRIKSDEVWHFYAGSGLTLYVIDKAGALHEEKLGSDPQRGESFQALVKAGCWFAARVDDPASYTLVGCTVAPGFEYEDFELAERSRLTEEYPQHKEIIERLTRSCA